MEVAPVYGASGVCIFQFWAVRHGGTEHETHGYNAGRSEDQVAAITSDVSEKEDQGSSEPEGADGGG